MLGPITVPSAQSCSVQDDDSFLTSSSARVNILIIGAQETQIPLELSSQPSAVPDVGTT